MATVKTKRKAREDAKKAALRQRIEDFARGAMGEYEMPAFDDEQFTAMASEMGMDAFGRWVGAVKRYILAPDHTSFADPRYLEHYDTIDTLTNFLFDADKKPKTDWGNSVASELFLTRAEAIISRIMGRREYVAKAEKSLAKTKADIARLESMLASEGDGAKGSAA